MKPKPETIILTIVAIAVLAFAFDYTRKSGAKQESEASSYYLKYLSNDVVLASQIEFLSTQVVDAYRTLKQQGERITALENRPAHTESDFAKNWKRHGLSVTNGIYVTPTPAEQAEIDRVIADWGK